MKTTGSGARTLARGLDILELLASAPRPLGVTELGEQLGLDKSTAHRLLTTLVKRGYARQDPQSRNYTIGAQALVLYDAFQSQADLQKICRPLLQELTDITGETSHLAVLSGVNIVFLDWVCTPQVMGVRTVVGRSEPAHCTALGKAILVALPEKQQDDILRGAVLHAYTVRTPVTLPGIQADFEASRVRGWTLDNEEFLLGVRCLAAAILDHTGHPVAALGISGPATRLSLARCRKLGPQVLSIARNASRILGYRTQEKR
jgi:DNA-binding IclR family transcriptional regulator